MMHFLNMVIFSLFIAPAYGGGPTTLCGALLRSDPSYSSVDDQLLDHPRVQDLLTGRKFSGLVVLLGKIGGGKTQLLRAFIEKLGSLDKPYVWFGSESSLNVTNVPQLRELLSKHADQGNRELLLDPDFRQELVEQMPRHTFLAFALSPLAFEGANQNSTLLDALIDVGTAARSAKDSLAILGTNSFLIKTLALETEGPLRPGRPNVVTLNLDQILR